VSVGLVALRPSPRQSAGKVLGAGSVFKLWRG
jgi:hypothetical protein